MHSISELQQVIIQHLNNRQVPQEPSNLYQPIAYFLGIGGKRLRPVLTLMSCDLFDVDIEKGIPAALAIEVFHNFTLMHDDIMDKAPLRRGRQTVHEKWNVNTAILSGDAMLIKAYDLLSRCPAQSLSKLMIAFNKMAFEVCEGQQYDMDYESYSNVSEDDYIQMIRLKTSVLLGTAFQFGAILGQCSEQDLINSYEFGVNLGIAFQLQDDILDVYGDPEKFGKQVGGDILENKKTILAINASKVADDREKEILDRWINDKQPDTNRKIKEVTEVFTKLGVKEITKNVMHQFAQKAFNALDNINVAKERKKIVNEFANDLLIREY